MDVLQHRFRGAVFEKIPGQELPREIVVDATRRDEVEQRLQLRGEGKPPGRIGHAVVKRLYPQPVAGGKPELLAGLPAEKFYTFSWSPGGKQFAFTRGREVRDVVHITDF